MFSLNYSDSFTGPKDVSYGFYIEDLFMHDKDVVVKLLTAL